MSEGLAAVAARMEPADAARVAQTLSEISRKIWEPSIQILTNSLEKEKDAKVQGDLAWSLGPLVDRLGTDEAARICRPGAERLSKALKETRNLDDRGFSLVKGLGAMMLRLPQDQAIKAIRLLATVAEETKGGTQSQTVGFYYLIGGLDAGDATRVARLLAAAVEKEKDPSIRWWLAAGLCRAGERMEPGEIAHVCGPVAKDMADAVATKKASGFLECSGYLVDGFSIVASKLGPVHAREAAKVLASRLEHETDLNARCKLAQALAAVAGRMDPTEAAHTCGQAANVLAEALGRETDYIARLSLASALSEVSGRMEPAEAARICTQAAKVLADALGRETDTGTRSSLASALSTVLGRLDPAEAARVCGGVMRLSVQKGVAMAPAGGSWIDPTLVPGLLRYLDPVRAKALTREVLVGLVSNRNVNELTQNVDPPSWSKIMDDTSTAEITRRAGFMAMMIGQGTSGQFAWAGALAAEPFPCRLTTQELVDLLKMPTCFGAARRVVLDYLGNRYGRRFVNHWAFVRYAQDQGLDLDFATPPKRPDPRESLDRMLRILDGPDLKR